jgi:hypothetical protein
MEFSRLFLSLKYIKSIMIHWGMTKHEKKEKKQKIFYIKFKNGKVVVYKRISSLIKALSYLFLYWHCKRHSVASKLNFN